MKNENKINEILGLPAIPKFSMADITNQDKSNSITAFTNESDVNKDVEITRQSLHHVIEQGTSALDEILDIAISSQRTEAFDSVATLIRAITASNKELMLVHKAKREILEVKPLDGQSGATQHAEVINNTQLNVTTSQMLEALRAEKENAPKDK